MCLAIFEPPGKAAPPDYLAMGWQRNSDGAGFAFFADGRIQSQRGFFKFKDFLSAYEAAKKKHSNAPFLVHFRIRSMGGKEADNTHPHSFKHGVMIHNGTLSGTTAKHSVGKSDTALFIERYGDDLTYDRLIANKAAFDEATYGNKMVFLFRDGRHFIINEKLGAWINGVWYSNQYSLPPAATSCSLGAAYGCHDV